MIVKIYIKKHKITVNDVGGTDFLTVPFTIPAFSRFSEQSVTVQMPTTKAAVLDKIRVSLVSLRTQVAIDTAAINALGDIPEMIKVDIGD